MLTTGQHIVFCRFSVVDEIVCTFIRGHYAMLFLCIFALLQAMKHMILVAVSCVDLGTA